MTWDDLSLVDRLMRAPGVRIHGSTPGGWWAEACGERAYGRTIRAAVAALAEKLR